MSTILIVEDIDLNRRLIRTLLEREGHAVIEAEDAETGIAVARERSPDLILMDIGLPGMDGLEATRILKDDTETRDIPVVAVTAHVLDEERRKCIQAGCAGFIGKPFDTLAFAPGLQRYLTDTSPST